MKNLTEGHVRVGSWEEFKHLVAEKRPKSIVFVLEQNGFSPNKELTNLRLILMHDRKYYIFLDSPKGDALRKTKIPFRKDQKGIPYLDEGEVKSFLEKEFEKEKIEVYSFWTT